MKRAAFLLSLAAFLAVLAAACSPAVKDTSNPTPTPTPSATGTGTPIPGIHLSADTTWPTAYSMTASMTVDPGVTLTIQSASTISIAQSATLYIAGTLDVNGDVMTAGGTPTVFQPDGSAVNWYGIDVVSGGVATIRNVHFTGYAQSAFRTEPGALTSTLYKVVFDGGYPLNISSDVRLCRAQFINGASDATGVSGTMSIVDSDLGSGGSGDAVHLAGASLVMSHSHDGVGTDPASSSHCLVHSDGSTGSTVAIDKSVFDAGTYLLMLSNVTASIHNSRIGDSATIPNYDSGSVAVDATGNYWGGTSTPNVPSNWTTMPVYNSATDSHVADAGIRPYGSGCETVGF